MKTLFAIHFARMPVTMVKGRWVYDEEERVVEVMAIAAGFVMVRRNARAMPYVVEMKEMRWGNTSTERNDLETKSV